MDGNDRHRPTTSDAEEQKEKRNRRYLKRDTINLLNFVVHDVIANKLQFI